MLTLVSQPAGFWWCGHLCDLNRLWLSCSTFFFNIFSPNLSFDHFSLDPSNFLLSVLPLHTEIELLWNSITSKFFSSQYHQKCNNGRLTIWSKCGIVLHESIFTFPWKLRIAVFFCFNFQMNDTMLSFQKELSTSTCNCFISLTNFCVTQLLIIPDPVRPKKKLKKKLIYFHDYCDGMTRWKRPFNGLYHRWHLLSCLLNHL